MKKSPTWIFSSQISREELATCFINRRQLLSADQMSEILTTNPFTQDLLAPEDLQKVRAYLSNHFPGASDGLIDDLVSLLSYAKAGDFFLNTYYGEIWPLREAPHSEGYFNRYVSLLSLLLESGPMPTRGWPHGRLYLTDFDGNVGAKALAGIEHGESPLTREETVDPMRLRGFLNDVLDFGALLAGFADRLDDPTWNSWFAVVHAIRKSRDGFLPMQRFDSQVSEILTTYFDVRGINLHNPKSADLSEVIPRTSQFWKCLNSSVDSAIPSWSEKLSRNGQRLAGLVVGALANDPFARLFVSVDYSLDSLVGCSFRLWGHVLGLTDDETRAAFEEVDGFHSPRGKPLFFNT